MTSAAAAAYRSELEAFIADLDPRIRGEDDMIHDTMSQALKDALDLDRQFIRRQRDQMLVVLREMTTLEDGGYPALPATELSAALFDELQREIADTVAAGQRFVLPQSVTSGLIEITPFKDVPTT